MQRQVKAAGLGGDLLQQRLVQARLDRVAVLILDERGVALLIGHAQHLAFRRADANGENAHPRLLRLFGGGHGVGVGVVIFAIGKEHHNSMIVVTFLESSQRGADGGRQGGAALGHDADRNGTDRLLEGLIVRVRGACRKPLAGENHQAEAVRFCQPHQVNRSQFGAFQAVGGNVPRQHAARSVQGHDDVQALEMGFLPGEPPLRTGQGQQEAGQGGDHQPHAELFPRGRNADRHRRPEAQLGVREERSPARPPSWHRRCRPG